MTLRAGGIHMAQKKTVKSTYNNEQILEQLLDLDLVVTRDKSGKYSLWENKKVIAISDETDLEKLIIKKEKQYDRKHS